MHTRSRLPYSVLLMNANIFSLHLLPASSVTPMSVAGNRECRHGTHVAHTTGVNPRVSSSFHCNETKV